ncbi:hypothetical protein IW261DRAFT_1419138 [Armillaria novae-zelandiae]|uniref:Uncharacterized protein n=1 Tax=Armillaria novae-zelandiae TaxID=153914 RepID=A0AA39PAV0_9AGAR|nr:hypothetical protein IW261DRAFT_1419138 [Armillaria novae-zelandiae]
MPISASPLLSTKERHDADDVWPFYVEEDNRRICKLCWAGDKHKNTKDKNYSMTCGKLNTLIKGNGMKAAEKFQKATGMTTPIGVSCSDTSSIPEFSRDAFIDAIVEWIIADDQKHQHSMGSISLTMDLSSDLNLVNYMAVTAHWMEPIGVDADGHTIVCLHSDLIGYHCVPGHHEGEHLAAAVLYITARVGITSKN